MIVINVEPCSIFVYITKPYYLFIYVFNYLIKSIPFFQSVRPTILKVVFMCVQFYVVFYSVLGLTSMGIDPISNNLTASICHLMHVFMFG